MVAHASSNGNGNGKPPGSGSPGDEVFKNLDLKSLNDLPLSKLTETANAVWERLKWVWVGVGRGVDRGGVEVGAGCA